MLTEDGYIRKRKRQAKRLGIRFLFMRVFPINHRKIVFSSFEGDGGFGCNPRYIAEELHKRNNDYEMVWLTHDTSRQFPDYLKVVNDSPWNIAYHLSTAKIWVDNYRKPYGTLKRKGQYYIQTWHASIGFKAVGLYRGDKFPKIARLVSEADSALIDCMVINSEYCRKVYPKKLLYDGYMLKAGSPRVDCIINERDTLREVIRKKYRLPGEAKILLYAPTFRSGNQTQKKEVKACALTLDFNKLSAELTKKYAGEWYFFIRLHPQLSAKTLKLNIYENQEKKVVDVSQEDDMSQLIAAADILLTDYSSCAFDASYACIPVFLYADDLEEYVNDRGSLMWKSDELPFSISRSNEMLLENIRLFDYENYCKKVSEFMITQGVLEDGKSSDRVADEIDRRMIENV